MKHPTSDCWTLRRIFKRKMDANQLRVGTGRPNDVREHPYPEHERAVHMAACYNYFAEEDEYTDEEVCMTSYYDHLDEIASHEQPRVTPDPDAAVKVLQGSTKFKTFYDALGFTAAARTEITRSIVNIAEAHQQACMAMDGSVPRTIREGANSITFSDADRRVTFSHNRPLYVTALIKGVELRRAFLDGGASINIMPLATFKKLGIPEN
jgi:hypothetical protein